MPYSLLTGTASSSTERTIGRALLVALVTLLVLLGLATMRLRPTPTDTVAQVATVAAVATDAPAVIGSTDDGQLHLSHADREPR
jgi:hypothetical protein